VGCHLTQSMMNMAKKGNNWGGGTKGYSQNSREKLIEAKISKGQNCKSPKEELKSGKKSADGVRNDKTEQQENWEGTLPPHETVE